MGRSHSLSTEPIQDPLATLPSILAIPGIRRQVEAKFQGRQPARQSVAMLLALDPLSVLRCLRQVHSPVYHIQRPVRTISDIVDVLGHNAIMRAMDQPPSNLSGVGDILKLWLHAIATAQAARKLAEQSGGMDPDEAYMCGLLHDFALWLHYLEKRSDTKGVTHTPRAWARHWNLDDEHVLLFDGIALTHTNLEGNSYADPLALVGGAELLAELADFWHPDCDDELARDLLLSSVSKEELIAARGLRLEVKTLLKDVGIETTPLDMPDQAALSGPSTLFGQNSGGSLGDVVHNLLQCTKSPTYRGVITATNAAALRFLGYDRAWYLVWVPATGHCVLRAKADLTPIRLESERVQPISEELAVLGQAFRSDKPRMLHIEHGAREGLLHRLGTDSAVVVALNSDFMSPTFLLLERSVSRCPIELEQESEPVRTLAGMASLLIENQLLQRKRRRAQRFALVDPLTQLANRGVGIHTLTKEVYRAQRNDLPLTVMMLDLDDFKKLNDTYGHMKGDVALRASAEVLRRSLRRSDTICRYGGEEFLAILPDTTAADAAVLATRVFTAVGERGEEIDLPITVSIGLAELIDNTEPPESLLHRADRALYASKASGRNRFSVDARIE